MALLGLTCLVGNLTYAETASEFFKDFTSWFFIVSVSISIFALVCNNRER